MEEVIFYSILYFTSVLLKQERKFWIKITAQHYLTYKMNRNSYSEAMFIEI